LSEGRKRKDLYLLSKVPQLGSTERERGGEKREKGIFLAGMLRREGKDYSSEWGSRTLSVSGGRNKKVGRKKGREDFTGPDAAGGERGGGVSFLWAEPDRRFASGLMRGSNCLRPGKGGSTT